MKRFWFVSAFLILSLLVGACGATPAPTNTPVPPTKTPVPPTNTPKPEPTDTPIPKPMVELGEEQRNAEGGFSYRVVPDYVVESFGNSVFMSAPEADFNTGPLFLLSGETLDEEFSLDEAFELFVSEFGEEDIQLGETRDITVGGAPGKEVDISGMPEGQEMAGRIVLAMPHADHMFSMIGISTGERWPDDIEPMFVALLQSVSFFPPEIEVEPTIAPIVEPTPGGLGEIRQWAAAAQASSEFSNPDWSAMQATGAPDTPECGDYDTAWASSGYTGEEWIALGYATPVIPTQVNIVQSYNPSQVVLVQLLDTAGEMHEIYSGTPQQVDECPYTLSIDIEDADYEAAAIVVTIDLSEIGDWNEIDAVELVGQGAGGSPVETPVPPPPAEVGPTVTPVPKPAAELESGWTIYSNGNTVQELAYHDGLIWAATGGGVVAWNAFDGTATKYTTLDGLPHNDVNAIISCPLPEPRVVAGTENGVAILNPDTDTWELLVPGDDAYIGDSRIASLACAYDSRILLIGYGIYGMHLWNSDLDEWTYLDTESGLGSDAVEAIGVVGDLEEVWTAGSRTITRISSDGTFTVYSHEDDEMFDTYVTHIVADAAGNIWMGSFIDEELLHFYDDTWTVYGPDNVDTFPFLGGAQALDIAPDGTIWIVSSFGNVCQFDPISESCIATYEDQPGQAGFPVHSLTIDPDGIVYYGSDGEGISFYDGSGWTQLLLDEHIASNELQSLGFDHYGNLWIGTSVDGLQILDPVDAEEEWISFTDLPSYSINTFYASPWGGIWVGHSAGASYYDGEEWLHLEEEDGILDYVDYIAADGQGRFWFGTTDGISIWDGQSFTTMNEASGLPGEYIRGLLYTPQFDMMWYGIWGEGLYGQDPFSVVIYDETNGLPNNNVSALALDLDGSLLVAADDTILRFDGSEFTVLYEAESWSAMITSIAVAPNGEIWAGDLFDGVYHFDGSAWEHLTTADGLPSNQYDEGGTVVIDHLGTVWFASMDGGLARYIP
ncbi:MAG: hypothetical protein JXA37_08770 [Chloroflexia bacterium]|nr:hypothetical protein [Chloroflexia bacterium]